VRAAWGQSLTALFRKAQGLISRPFVLAARVAFAAVHGAAKEIAQRLFLPSRPAGMCEAQRVDYLAACDGKITWRQYYAKWGDTRLTL